MEPFRLIWARIWALVIVAAARLERSRERGAGDRHFLYTRGHQAIPRVGWGAMEVSDVRVPNLDAILRDEEVSTW